MRGFAEKAAGWAGGAAALGLLTAVALLPGTAGAQTGGATASVRGVVVDAQTHRPIARVLVEGQGGPGLGVLTDNSGQFRLDGLQPGALTVHYRRPGYLDPYSEQEYADAQMLVTDDTAPVTLALEKTAAIEGQLQAPDGDSADGLRVDLYSSLVVGGHRRWQVLRSARVEADGSFAFDGLQPGSYLVHSQASEDPAPSAFSAAVESAVRGGYAPLFAPGTGELSGATVYRVGPGETAEARIRLKRVAFEPVAVKVVGDGGHGGYFDVTGNGFTRWSVGGFGQEGVLHTHLPSGSYHMRGDGQGGGGAGKQRVELQGDLAFQVSGSPVEGLAMQLSATPPMQVTTTVEGDTGVDGQGGVAQTQEPRIYTFQMLRADDPEQPMQFVGVDESVHGETQPLQQAVPPGKYWVVPIVGGGYLASLTGDGVDLVRGPLTVVAGTTPALRAVLRQDGGTVQVTLGGELAGHATMVQLLPLDGQAGPQATGSAQGAATPLTFRNVAPGNYLAVAVSGRNEVPYREPGVLQGLHGEPVQVTAGATAQVTIARQAKSAGDAGGS